MLLEALRCMPATYAGLAFQLRTVQMPWMCGISSPVVEITVDVQANGLALETDVIGLVIYPAGLLYSRIFGNSS